MNTFNKVVTLFRGQLRQGTENLLDANALALLDQQLFDTEQCLISARRDLARLMAERRLQEKQLVQTCDAISRYEECARGAMQMQQQGLLQETAERIAELEQRRDQEQQLITELSQREQEFQEFIRDSGENLRTLRQQQALVRVSDRMHRSSNRLQGHGKGLADQLSGSRETLMRIEERQQRARFEWQAMGEVQCQVEGEGLDQRLQAAGLMASKQSRAAEVIARLKAVPKEQ